MLYNIITEQGSLQNKILFVARSKFNSQIRIIILFWYTKKPSPFQYSTTYIIFNIFHSRNIFYK